MMIPALLAAASMTYLPVSATAIPARPFIEDRMGTKHLNFDVMLYNATGIPLRLVAIREQIFAVSGELQQQREVNANGKPSAMSGLGDLVLLPGTYKDLFQPFQEYLGAPKGAKLRLTFVFLRADRPIPPVAIEGDAIAQVDIVPRAYHPVDYCLPLTGRLLVHDGHDLYSHHRRRDLVAAAQGGDPSHGRNANLYAYDFVRIDGQGALFRGKGLRKEDWLTFGAEILAPVDGKVVEAVDGVPDNSFVNGQAVTPESAQTADPLGLGNHVLVRAKDGRVSWLLHMETGSVAVKVGQSVVAGQILGRVGFSGDSLFPHLHYTVTNGASYPSQGVPSYFKYFSSLSNDNRQITTAGGIDSGDIIEVSSCKASGGLKP